MAWIPDNTTLEQLKCSTCKNYLSVGPVTQTQEGYNCGRCSTAEDGKNTIFEILAKNCRFSCRYDVSGCSAKLEYGEEAINHEKVCEFRISSCPVGDSCECEWNGLAITSYEHCLNVHKECIVVESNDFEFNVNLRESVNKKSMMKRTNGEMLLLHLLYSEEMGLSINIRSFIAKNQNMIYCCAVVLQCSDEKNRIELKSRGIAPSYCFKPMLERIPFHTLCCLDKTAVSIIINVERDHSAAASECDNCNQALPLYILKCSKNHRFCNKCHDVEQECIICSASLQISSNYNAMKTEKGSLGCCNVVYGCNFFGNLSDLQEHEEKCALYKCLLETCQWRGFDRNFWKHVTTQHYSIETHTIKIDHTIVIRDEDLKDNTYFEWLTANCDRQHTHKRGLFIVQILVDDTKNTIRLVANYNMLSANTTFFKGNLQVIVGNDIIYIGEVRKMTGAIFDRSGEIQFTRSFFKQELLIDFSGYIITCNN